GLRRHDRRDPAAARPADRRLAGSPLASRPPPTATGTPRSRRPPGAWLPARDLTGAARRRIMDATTSTPHAPSLRTDDRRWPLLTPRLPDPCSRTSVRHGSRS